MDANTPTPVRELLDALCDGTLSAAGLQELDARALADTEVRGLLLTYLQLDGFLRWEFGGSLRQPESSILPAAATKAEVLQAAVIPAPLAPLRKLPVASLFDRVTARLGRSATWSILAAVGIMYYGYFGLITWGMLDKQERNDALEAQDGVTARADLRQPESVPSGQAPEASSQSPAHITAGMDAKWADSSDVFGQNEDLANFDSETGDRGAPVAQGKSLELASGIVELQLKRGVTLLVEGPAEWTLVDDNRISLSSGKLVARVSRQAIGFTVETPTARFVDLGTEFGVQVDESLKSYLRVFRGKVRGELRAASASGSGVPQAVEVTAAQSFASTGSGFTVLQDTSLVPIFSKLRKTLAGRREPLPAYVLAHWRFENAVPAPVGSRTQIAAISDASGYDHPLDYWPGQVGPYPTTDRTPPLAMFRSGYNGGSRAFHPAAMDNSRSGVLFYDSARTGPAFAFTHDFTIEGYFRTDGPRASAGPMTLLFKDLYLPSWEVVLNEPHPGALALKLTGDTGESVLCAAGGQAAAKSISGNLADGQWCYFAARVHLKTGEVSLLVGREDGTVLTGAANLPAGFAFPTEKGCPENNLFVGRKRHQSHDRQTFAGTIDELRISRIWLEDSELLFPLK